ncbi:hypothetical protein FDP41_006758 [Naegleria fowleri]|uniref:Translation initiation factor IF2/IF5 domain-containing protein n=1 Tax=Naegleria fowleri TaxID=5763 RepID=A0A6A5BJA7_NAEFO|nr:uncharacterized protein FDP41_006758 [Naegleria fowleri]KAF0974148.1 hypothetical protein FDP41_006758 [Naegleria fowleri]
MSSVVDEKALGLDLKKPKKKSTSSSAEKTEKKTKKTSTSEEKTESSEELQLILKDAAQLFKQALEKVKEEMPLPSIDTNVEEDENINEIVDLLKTKKSAEVIQIINKKQQSQSSGGSYWSEDREESAELQGSDRDLASLLAKDDDHGPQAWNKSDRNYKYPELLERIFDTLKKNNPELGGGKRKPIKVKTPQVARDGPKKTVLINFTEICANLHRAEQHVLDYLFAELGTTGNLDGSNRLVIRGAFKSKDIENLLRKYITEYVVCKICNSLDTRLNRDPTTRLYSIHCANCLASRTVSAVKQGFVANLRRKK